MVLFSWQTWLVVTIVCGLVELFWFNTYTLCISIAAFLTMLATIFGIVTGPWQAIVFAVLAGLILLANEKLVKPYIAQTKGEKDEPETADKNTKAD
jgi:membrane protein implicated in regulation of membrane protease activity